MLVRVDPNGSQAAILSFPRDLWVKIGTSNRKSRINSAFDKGDPSRLVQTIELNFGVPVDHTSGRLLRVQVRSWTPSAGSNVPFAYPTGDKFTGLDIPAPGCYSMSGDAALAYARSRHYQYEENGRWKEDGSSDRGRIRRQQDFIKRMLRRPSTAERPVPTSPRS